MKSNVMRLLACITLLLWQITAFAQTNPIIDDSFGRSNTSVGSSPLSTNVTGPDNSTPFMQYYYPSTGGAYIDEQGTLWRIYNGYLVCATGTAGSPYQRLLRPANENALNQRIVLTTRPLASTTETYYSYLRDQASSGNGLVGKFNLATGTNNAYAVIAFHPSTGETDLIASTNFTTQLGHQYVCSFSCTGSSPTTMTVSVADLASPSTVIATATTTTSGLNSLYSATYYDVEAAGQFGVGTDDTAPITGIARIQTFNNASPLSSGTISQTAVSSSTVSLSATAATGGTGPYTYQWYKSQTAGFDPGSGSLISGATSLTPTVSLPNSGLWFVKVRATDSVGATYDSAQFACRLLSTPYPTLSVGFAGDDPTGYTHSGAYYDTPAQQTLKALQYIGGGYRIVNQSANLDQSISASTTALWASGGSYLTTAKAAWAAQSVQVVSIQLGESDAFYGVTPSAYGANLSSMVSDLTSSGYLVILHYPAFVWSNWGSYYSMDQQNTILQGYCAQIDSLVNGTTVLQGDKSAYAHFALFPGDLVDTVHEDYNGSEFLGHAWPAAIAKALGILP